MQKVLDFIKYNNAFTILVGLFFFVSGVTFAASPDARSAVYASNETVVSVDNGLILATDFSSFNFNLRIGSVTEDSANYYADYSYQTFVIEDGIWKNKEISKTLTVNKEALGGKDLGLYVAKELGDNMNYELSYLERVQQIERQKGEQKKVVNIEYSGLVGKMLNPEQKVIEGYVPVIPEPLPETQKETKPATVETNPAEVILTTPVSPPESTTTVESVATSTSTSTSASQSTSGDVVDDTLVQEVVNNLLQNATSTSVESTTTPTGMETPAPAQ